MYSLIARPPIGTPINWGSALANGLWALWDGRVPYSINETSPAVHQFTWQGGATPTILPTPAGSGIKLPGSDNSSWQMTQLPTGGFGSLTLAAWFVCTYTGGNATDQWYLGQSLLDADMPGFTYDFGSSVSGSVIQYGIGHDGGGQDVTAHGTINVATGLPIHYIYTWNSITGALNGYVNGVLDVTASTTASGLRSAVTGLWIGENNDHYGPAMATHTFLWAGVWNRELSPIEARALYIDMRQLYVVPSRPRLFSLGSSAAAAAVWPGLNVGQAVQRAATWFKRIVPQKERVYGYARRQHYRVAGPGGLALPVSHDYRGGRVAGDGRGHDAALLWTPRPYRPAKAT